MITRFTHCTRGRIGSSNKVYTLYPRPNRLFKQGRARAEAQRVPPPESALQVLRGPQAPGSPGNHDAQLGAQRLALLHGVRGEHHRPPRECGGDHVPQVPPRLGVHAGGGLVQEYLVRVRVWVRGRGRGRGRGRRRGRGGEGEGKGQKKVKGRGKKKKEVKGLGFRGLGF
eukprot:159986-Prorocentrum_minimum.AAC.1